MEMALDTTFVGYSDIAKSVYFSNEKAYRIFDVGENGEINTDELEFDFGDIHYKSNLAIVENKDAPAISLVSTELGIRKDTTSLFSVSDMYMLQDTVSNDGKMRVTTVSSKKSCDTIFYTVPNTEARQEATTVRLSLLSVFNQDRNMLHLALSDILQSVNREKSRIVIEKQYGSSPYSDDVYKELGFKKNTSGEIYNEDLVSLGRKLLALEGERLMSNSLKSVFPEQGSREKREEQQSEYIIDDDGKDMITIHSKELGTVAEIQLLDDGIVVVGDLPSDNVQSYKKGLCASINALSDKYGDDIAQMDIDVDIPVGISGDELKADFPYIVLLEDSSGEYFSVSGNDALVLKDGVEDQLKTHTQKETQNRQKKETLGEKKPPSRTKMKP